MSLKNDISSSLQKKQVGFKVLITRYAYVYQRIRLAIFSRALTELFHALRPI